ncbi:MarR family winged helix-turn-helix transcriptional regulator [Clostridium uliginosum]|uniref:DNA-binding transcriptional regulator, MarR family n=1 Tax=Clostridium uliginosum TaxID=119641 RepID=A0A1I1RED1_9CLOT|nr:transcriptional regulator [Clostridium uliginosum]SFD32602.1 DNA-binding transcriptional regulator, MarR family [Clostridium uliginosum]
MNKQLYNSKLEEGLSRLQCELVAERNKINKDNISWFQYDLLESLYHTNGSRPAELSSNLGVSRSKISKGLKVLKDMGYVKQEKSNSDARELWTVLTDKGFKFLKEVQKDHEHLAEITSFALTSNEQELFAELCLKVSRVFEERRR